MAASIVGLAAIVVGPVFVKQGGIAESGFSIEAEAISGDHQELRGAINEAEEALRGFYRAVSVSEILHLIRAPERLQDSVQTYYAGRPPMTQYIEFMGSTERIRHKNGTFILAVVKLPEAVDGRQVAVEMSEEGPKVDWELAVNLQKRNWLMLSRSALIGEPQTFRVEATGFDYYNNEFKEPEWRSYRLTAPESPDPVYAYAPRRSSLGERLQESITASYPHPAQLVVSLAVVERVDEISQMRIFDLQHAHWLVPAEALPVQVIENHKKLSLIDNF